MGIWLWAAAAAFIALLWTGTSFGFLSTDLLAALSQMAVTAASFLLVLIVPIYGWIQLFRLRKPWVVIILALAALASGLVKAYFFDSSLVNMPGVPETVETLRFLCFIGSLYSVMVVASTIYSKIRTSKLHSTAEVF